ncbi:hypothetical protein [Streptomyces niveus]
MLTYSGPAVFIAGTQASPGAGTLNLIVYTVLALPALTAVVLFLLGLLIASGNSVPFNNVPFNSALTLGILALVAGLVVPWIVDVNQPWHWIADRLGVI